MPEGTLALEVRYTPPANGRHLDQSANLAGNAAIVQAYLDELRVQHAGLEIQYSQRFRPPKMGHLARVLYFAAS